jgi:hypothetical protein
MVLSRHDMERDYNSFRPPWSLSGSSPKNTVRLLNLELTAAAHRV